MNLEFMTRFTEVLESRCTVTFESRRIICARLQWLDACERQHELSDKRHESQLVISSLRHSQETH